MTTCPMTFNLIVDLKEYLRLYHILAKEVNSMLWERVEEMKGDAP